MILAELYFTNLKIAEIRPPNFVIGPTPAELK
jgi:hypothetical protein